MCSRMWFLAYTVMKLTITVNFTCLTVTAFSYNATRTASATRSFLASFFLLNQLECCFPGNVVIEMTKLMSFSRAEATMDTF